MQDLVDEVNKRFKERRGGQVRWVKVLGFCFIVMDQAMLAKPLVSSNQIGFLYKICFSCLDMGHRFDMYII